MGSIFSFLLRISEINNNLAQQPDFIYDATGKITGYKTPGGADTVFPFSDFERPQKIVYPSLTISSFRELVLPTYGAKQILITAPSDTAGYSNYLWLSGRKSSLGKYILPIFENGMQNADLTRNANGQKINISDYNYLILYLNVSSSTATLKDVTIEWFYE